MSTKTTFIECNIVKRAYWLYVSITTLTSFLIVDINQSNYKVGSFDKSYLLYLQKDRHLYKGPKKKRSLKAELNKLKF